MLRVRLDETRKNLTSVNRTIASIEDQLHPATRRNVEEQIYLKTAQLAELELAKPEPVPAPAETRSPAQKAAATTLAEILAGNERLDAEARTIAENAVAAAARRKAVRNVRERLALLRSQVDSARSEIGDDLRLLDLTEADVLLFEIRDYQLVAADNTAIASAATLAARTAEIAETRQGYAERLTEATEALNGPQRAHQDFLGRMKAWQGSADAIEGTADVPDSRKGLQARLQQLDSLPAALVERRTERCRLAGEILEVLALQRDQRSRLFEPVQALVRENALVGEEYRLQFESNLAAYHDAVS